MPRISVLAAVMFGLLLFPAASKAQDAIDSSKPVDPQLRADILRLIDVTHALERAQEGARASAEWMRPRLIAVLPAGSDRQKIAADYIKRVESIPKSPEYLNGLVAIYAKYFSDDDVKALIQFYATPAGQHFNQHAKDISTYSMQLSRQVAAEKLTDIFAGLCSDHPELRGQVKFCSFSTGDSPAPGPK